MTMNDTSASFLEEALGKAGADALLKAVRRSPALASVLVPRAIIGWAMSAAAWEYQGFLPGRNGYGVAFRKSEKPGLYSGSITDGLNTETFTDATLYRVAAHLAVWLKAEPGPVDAQLKDLDLARLGKSIDTLAKAQLLAQATTPQVVATYGDIDVVHAGLGTHPFMLRRRRDLRVIIDGLDSLADARRLAEDQSRADLAPTPDLDKVEPPGSTHKPTAQQGPTPPEAPKMQPRQQRPPPRGDGKVTRVKAPPRTDADIEGLPPPPKVDLAKQPQLKVGKAEAHGNRCQLCHQTQFSPDGSLMGCLCFRGLIAAGDVLVKAEEDSYSLTFGASWDEDARAALLEALQPV